MGVRCDECPHWGEPNSMSNAWCDLNGVYTHATTGCLDRELELERKGDRRGHELLKKAPASQRPALGLISKSRKDE